MPNLQPLQGDRDLKQEPFAVFDIETNGWDKFLVVGYWDGFIFRHFDDMGKFLTFVLEETSVRVVFAHNGGKFDFLFVLDRLLRAIHQEKKKYMITKMMERGSALLSVKVLGKYREVMFADTIAFLPYKLDTLTKTFQVEHRKLEIDHNKRKVINEELLEYLKHDCIGLFEVVTRYSGQELIKRAGFKYTTASQALQVWRLYLKEPIHDLNPEDDAWIRESYFGGRTEIFKPAFFGSKNKKKLRVYDVNSLYPTVMRDFPYPIGKPFPSKRYTKKKLGVWDVTVKVPEDLHIPPLGAVIEVNSQIKRDTASGEMSRMEKRFKFLFPVGSFRGKWTNVELEYAKSLGVKIKKVHQGMVFKHKAYLFRDFINDMYARRMKAKEEKDDVQDTIAKLMMNSLYGRTGLDRNKEEIMLDDGQVLPGTIKTEHWMQLEERGLRYSLIRRPTYLKTSFSNVSIATFVTSYARIHMHKLYMSLGKELYYTDTDSVFTTAELPTGKKLGEVKLEAEGDEACFLLPKTYIMRGKNESATSFNIEGKEIGYGDEFRKAASKGMDKEFMKRYSVHDFYEMLEGESRIIESHLKGRGLLGFRSALARRGCFVVAKPDMKRKIRASYDKRVVYKEKGIYETRPIKVSLTSEKASPSPDSTDTD